jgi:hypothetical protein
MAPKDPPRSDESATLEEGAEERRQAALKELRAEWDRRLACLNHPDAARRVEAMMDKCGRTKKRPIAGSSD